MQSWTSGYVSTIEYTYGYYSELNPIKAKLAFLYSGLVPPNHKGIHCELGFGQGISTNIHAAAIRSTWYGNDFNPTQASFAKSIAEATGADTHLSDESFLQFCQRKDLPRFDSIGLHGIWSWISDENRRLIVSFIEEKLKVGGVVYISYNTLPGWANFIPMRHLLTTYVEIMGTPGRGTIKNINNSLEFAKNIMETKPNYLKANPQVNEKLNNISKLERNYLAHEYYNKDWEPMHFSDMNKWLSQAKLSYACSANFIDHIDNINLTKEQQSLINQESDSTLKETIRDFCINQQFRRDYWVKGIRKINNQERTDRLREIKIILITPIHEVKFKALSPQGEITLNENTYKPIIECLVDYKIKSVKEIEKEIIKENIPIENLLQAIFLLIGLGNIALVEDEQDTMKSKYYTDKLNKLIIDKSEYSAEINYLASPLIGAGISINRFQQLFLLAKEKGLKTNKEWALYTWNILKNQNQRIISNGLILETDELNINELKKQAEDFENFSLPILKVLGVV